MKYAVTYEQDVVVTYDAIVEADSEEEAIAKIEDGDFESEEEVDYQGVNVRIIDVQEMLD